MLLELMCDVSSFLITRSKLSDKKVLDPYELRGKFIKFFIGPFTILSVSVSPT